MKTGATIYSLMGMLREDYFGTLRKLADTGCQYIEYVSTPADENGVPVASPAEIGRRVKEMGLTPVSSHVKFTSDPDSMKKVIEENLEMGAPRLVLPFELMNTRDQVKALAETCNEMGRRCKENGLEFYYHNHCQEFYMVEGKTAYDWLVELTDPELVGFEVDTFWAKRGGQDPCALIRKLGPRAGLIHQKDMGISASPVDLVAGVTGMTRDNFRDKIFARTNPTDICVVGTGTMEIQEIVETVTELGYASTIVVELDCCARETEEKFDTPLSPLASIKASREYLETVINR